MQTLIFWGKKVRLVISIPHKDDFRTKHITEIRKKTYTEKEINISKVVKILNVPANHFCFMFLSSIN